MSNACQKCGAPVQDGAFLGLCPACSQGEATAEAPSISARSGGQPSWLKPALIIGGIVGILFILVLLLPAH